MQLFQPGPGAREIVPDYQVPDALCVPLWAFDIRPTLEALAAAAAAHVGVILITPSREDAEAFIAAQPEPGHFGVVLGAYDSPWLRDHAPIAVREAGALHQIRPALPDTGRPNDPALFATILPGAQEVTPHLLAGGNLVAGPGGLAVSTDNVLTENGLDDAAALGPMARQLGIRDWLIVPRFADDISGHTDLMLRFLSPELCALCTRPDAPEAGRTIAALREALAALRPGLGFLELPAVAGAAGFNSPLNWVQFGRTLLVPEFGADDPFARARRERLRAAGFDPVAIPTGTGGLGGALHCLTASIHAG